MIKRIKNYVLPAEDSNSDEDRSETQEKKIDLAKPKMVDEGVVTKRKLIKQMNQKEEEEDVNEEYIYLTLFRIRIKFCLLCNKKLVSRQDYNLHLNSRKHKLKLKRATVFELKEAGSIRKFLQDKGYITGRRSKLNRLRTILYSNSLKNLLQE